MHKIGPKFETIKVKTIMTKSLTRKIVADDEIMVCCLRGNISQIYMLEEGKGLMLAASFYTASDV